MAEVGEFGGPSFGGPGAFGGASDEEREYSNAIARNVLGISTNPSTYGAPLDSPEAANYGFGLGSNLASISPNLAQYAQPFLNPTTGLAQFEPGFFDFSGAAGAKKATELGFFDDLKNLGLAQVSPNTTMTVNFPSIIGKKMSPVAYGTKQQQQEVIESLYDNRQISLPTAITYGALVNHMNPESGQLNVNPDTLDIESYIEGIVHGLPGVSTNVTFDDNAPYGMQQEITPFGINTGNVIGPFGMQFDATNIENIEPSIELYDPLDTTPNTNLGVNAILDAFGIDNQSPTSQQEVDALMDDVLGMQFEDGINFDPDDMSMAMASVEDDPWGYNQSVIDGLNASFDTGAVSEAGGEALQEALAQRAAETMIAQQAARQQSNKVTIPVSSGPDIVIDVTPPAPQKVAPHRRTPPPPSPVKVAATSVARPKAFKKLPKFAQKEIRKGKVPTGGSDYVQDMVRQFLNPPKPIDYSNPDMRGGK